MLSRSIFVGHKGAQGSGRGPALYAYFRVFAHYARFARGQSHMLVPYCPACALILLGGSLGVRLLPCLCTNRPWGKPGSEATTVLERAELRDSWE